MGEESYTGLKATYRVYTGCLAGELGAFPAGFDALGSSQTLSRCKGDT